MCRSSKLANLYILLLLIVSTACAPAATPLPPTATNPPPPTNTPVPPPTNTPAPTLTPTPAPELERLPLPESVVDGMFDVGDHQLYLVCYGEGSPTVILEHGWGADSSTWDRIVPYIATKTRVCAYDRASSGRSDFAKNRRTLAQVGEELSNLLQAAKIDGPYVLAGHSLGGFLVLNYASLYPATAAGLVLVDSAYLDDCANVLKMLPTPSPQEARGIADTRKACKSLENWKMEGIADIDPAIRAIKSLGDIPLVVVVHASVSKITEAWYPGVAADLVDKLEQLWRDEQKEYTQLSTNSTFILAKNSAHFVQNDEPQLVIDAILDLVDTARQK